ncbi:MAG: class I SAM-dependent methyltransferase [Candidatus Omnitrophota bacterium]
MNTAEANRSFYNLVAGEYEKADGRRKQQAWLEDIIRKLHKTVKTDGYGINDSTFLDVGAGSGYITHIASDYFRNLIAVDLSEEMLKRIPVQTKRYVLKCESAEKMSIGSERVDVACAFATLHHLENLVTVFKEIHRVLKPGGIFYADHDIESHFVSKYKMPLAVYRAIKNKKGAFARISKEAGKLYDTVEHRKDGIDSDRVRITLTALGFKPYITYHWQGILPIDGDFKKGQAPMMRIFAVKQ